MKKTTSVWMGWWLLILAIAGARAQTTFPDELRQALKEAVARAEAAIAASGLPKDRPLAVLPVRGDVDRADPRDHGYLGGLLENAFTAAGLNVVPYRRDALWDEIFDQVEWSERKEDILDAKTLTAFGRLQNTKLLAYAFVRDASIHRHRVFVEIELHVSEIETARHLWGGTFSSRLYIPGPREGLVALDTATREAFQAAIAAKAEALESSEKLKEVRTLLVIPLAGDIDGYFTGMIKAMFNRSPIRLRDADVPTLTQARLVLRDGGVDGVLHGAVRDLYREAKKTTLEGTTYTVRAEVQLEIQKANGDVLWADQIVATTEEFVPRPESPEDEIKRTLLEIILQNPAILLWIVAGAGAIILMIAFLRSTRRVR